MKSSLTRPLPFGPKSRGLSVNSGSNPVPPPGNDGASFIPLQPISIPFRLTGGESDEIRYQIPEYESLRRSRHLRSTRIDLLLSDRVSGGVVIPLRQPSSEVSASSMAIRNSTKSSAKRIFVPADLGTAFKRCCRNQGRYDGSLRHDYFRR